MSTRSGAITGAAATRMPEETYDDSPDGPLAAAKAHLERLHQIGPAAFEEIAPGFSPARARFADRRIVLDNGDLVVIVLPPLRRGHDVVEESERDRLARAWEMVLRDERTSGLGWTLIHFRPALDG